jgi:3-phenylpropionate/trans-cinnamate dioxygenase ferredoxin reductase subunit
MSARPAYVIVGASMAGATAADTLRREGFDGPITLIGAEHALPYERPPLSKEFLRGESSRDDVLLNPQDYYRGQSIELRLGQVVTALDVGRKLVQLDSGERVPYSKVLVATGATPRRLAVPGSDLEGIFYLRTLADAAALRDALASKPRVVVIGAGFIGAEVAATARGLGCEVTVLEVLPVPLSRALGDEMGAIYAGFHREQGVDLRTNEGIAQFVGASRLEAAVTNSGDTIPCEVALIGIGVTPAVGFLEGSGVEVDNGIVVDEYCRASVPGVFAAGDVANWWHPAWQERLRLEHYDNASNQAIAAARSMLGKGKPYAPVPYFWSDQYDLRLQYVGHASRWDEAVMRGTPEGRSFSVFYLLDGRLRACLMVNRPRDQRAARRLVQTAEPVDAAQLRDETVDLDGLGR